MSKGRSDELLGCRVVVMKHNVSESKYMIMKL